MKIGLIVKVYMLIVKELSTRSYIYNISPFLIFAQAWHETDVFSSKICKENKNLFGMKRPSVRDNLVVDENRGHAVYRSYGDSVRDYFLWADYFFKDKIVFSGNLHYVKEVVAMGYAEDVSYHDKWLGVYKKVMGFVNTSMSFLVLFLLGLPLVLRNSF